VVKRGGLVNNEQYDTHGRWIGSINFGGDVFLRLKNYTPNNRATSVSYQLLQNYRKFLRAYELAWRGVDLPAVAVAPGGRQRRGRGGGLLKGGGRAGSERPKQQRGTGTAPQQPAKQALQQKGSSSSQFSDPLDMLACLADLPAAGGQGACSPGAGPTAAAVQQQAGGVTAAAGSASEDEAGQHAQPQRRGSKRQREAAEEEDTWQPPSWRRSSSVGAAIRTSGSLQPAAAAAEDAWMEGGRLVLVTEGPGQGRTWGAVVPHLRDLPLEVLQGEMHPPGCSFPTTRAVSRLATMCRAGSSSSCCLEWTVQLACNM
jgi:hypothetical protein